MPVDRPWAELLVHCDDGLLPFVSVMSAMESLHRMTREERDLAGLVVRGSDNLTAYNVYAEALTRCGFVGEVYGLPRHLFDEGIEQWAERRGVLVKAIEDAALGDGQRVPDCRLPLPSTMPQASERVQRAIRRAARANTAVRSGHRRGDGRWRVGAGVTTSVAGSWGAVAGTLRYFADRWGVSRAAIEGTQIPMDVIRKYATRGAGTLVYHPRRHGAPYAMQYPIVYRGFELELEREAADEDATAGGRRPTQT